MRFGLHRSLVFWAGVLMTVFIGWAARDSREHASGVAAGRHQLVSVCGGVLVTRGSGFLTSGYWDAHRQEGPVVATRLESPFFLRGTEDATMGTQEVQGWPGYYEYCVYAMGYHAKSSWLLFIPYWLLWAAMAVVWVGLLVWRQRRGRERDGI